MPRQSNNQWPENNNPIAEVAFMNIVRPKPSVSKAVLQPVDLSRAVKGHSERLTVHAFEWSERSEMAVCSCRNWTMWGQWPGALTRESAKRSHEDHRRNRLASSAKGDAEASTDVA